MLEVKPGWQESPRLWIGLVADPGTMKSPALDLVTQWARKRQVAEFKTFQEEQEAQAKEKIEYGLANVKDDMKRGWV